MDTEILIEFIVLTIIYLCLTNWFQLFNFLSVIVDSKHKTSSVNDQWIKSTVKKKTGLSLLDITIFHDKRMYGMMAGLPFWPKLIISEGLYKSFNKDEMEWVILLGPGIWFFWLNFQPF